MKHKISDEGFDDDDDHGEEVEGTTRTSLDTDS